MSLISSRQGANPWWCLAFASLPLIVLAQPPKIPSELPASAAAQLATSLAEASKYREHPWRDIPSMNSDGTVNGYVEIARGDRRKWEFRIGANARAIDRTIPEQIGGYPVNYGFVPQTISYDGDPFDVLVLGPPIEGGTMVHGIVVGLLLMADEKGLDHKVVVSRATNGRPDYALTDRDRQEIAGYFQRYKLLDDGKFSKVPGWGSTAEGLALVRTTHAFFEQCRKRSEQPTCRVALR
jgi:inorganic pyrophosphatase